MRQRWLTLATALVVLGMAVPARGGDSSLGLGSCGWIVRNDPTVVNVLYPDEDAVYYLAALPSTPPGFSYRIRGEFPRARYISFVSYNGLPVDALLDEDIVPDADSSNPFLPGADRTVPSRSYTVPLTAAPPPSDPASRVPGTLYIGEGQLGVPTPVPYLLYRIYVPDAGTGPRGGVGLPQIELVAGAGDTRADAEVIPCEGARDAAPDVSALHDAVAGSAFPIRPPLPGRNATDPPTWEVQTGTTAAVLGRVGQGDLVSGGPGSNPHSNYVVATISRAFGEVVAIRARAPVAPRTRDGQPTMSTGDLRYWSICQNSRTTRYVDCLSNEDVQVDDDGFFTVAVSTPEHRPSTASNWLAFGPEPDGLVIYRHMLPSPEFFPHSAQGVAASDDPIDQVMGEYFPHAVYCSASEFEENRCGL